jgi:hypothetical protein
VGDEHLECDLGTASPDLKTLVTWQWKAKLMRPKGQDDPPSPDVHVREARTGKELRKFPHAGDQPDVVAFAPDGKSLALVWSDSPVRVYNAATGKEVYCLASEGTHLHDAAYAADGRTFLAGGSDGTLHVWELATRKERARILLHPGKRFGFALSPDGRLLASWSGKGSIRVWDFPGGRELARLSGHEGTVNAAAFSPDGRRLLSGSEDTTVLLWDVADLMKPEKAKPLPPGELAALWEDLATEDAAKALRAMVALEAAPEAAVAHFGKLLAPVRAPSAERVAHLVADLDSDQYAVREGATRELTCVVDMIAPALREALASRAAPEVRMRLEGLLEAHDTGAWASGPLRVLRMIEVLERIGTAPARGTIEELSKGAPEARLTREAKASLERLTRRSDPRK